MKTSPSLYVHFMQQIHPNGLKGATKSCGFCFSDRIPKAVVKTTRKKKTISLYCKVCKNKAEHLTSKILIDKKKKSPPVCEIEQPFEINSEPEKNEEELRKIREDRKNRKKQKKAFSGLIIPETISRSKPSPSLSALRDSAKVLSIANSPSFSKMLSKYQPKTSNTKLNNFLLKK